MPAFASLLAVVLGLSSAPGEAAEPADAPPPPAEPDEDPEAEPEPATESVPLFSRGGLRRRFRLFERNGRTNLPPTAKPVDGRRFMIGLEGVILSAPPIRSRVIYIDPRYPGRSVALGGVGLFGRFRPIALIGVDFSVHSGSVRYSNRDGNDSVSQDHVLFDAGVLLYLARGNVAQFAFSGGVGGMWTRVGYEQDGGGNGRHTFGSALFRVGGEAEFLVKRVAFVLSFRNYAMLTDRDAVVRRGSLVQADTPKNRVAPVATFQTMLLGSAGIAYRF